MFTFLCVLKRSHHYNKNQVYELKKQIEKFYTGAHKFICLSDKKLHSCDYILLEDNLNKFWNKIELFKHDFGKCIYLDLDVVIQKNIDWIDDLDINDNVFWIMPDFPERKNNSINSSLMAWSGDKKFIYDNFDYNIIKKKNIYQNVMGHKFRYSDQWWISDQLSNTDIELKFFDDKKVIQFYKSSLKEKQNADIMYFSSLPKKEHCFFNTKYKTYTQFKNFNTNTLITEYFNDLTLKKFLNISDDIKYLKFKILLYEKFLNVSKLAKTENLFYLQLKDTHLIDEWIYNILGSIPSSLLNLTEDLKNDISQMIEKDKIKLSKLLDNNEK